VGKVPLHEEYNIQYKISTSDMSRFEFLVSYIYKQA